MPGIPQLVARGSICRPHSSTTHLCNAIASPVCSQADVAARIVRSLASSPLQCRFLTTVHTNRSHYLSASFLVPPATCSSSAFGLPRRSLHKSSDVRKKHSRDNPQVERTQGRPRELDDADLDPQIASWLLDPTLEPILPPRNDGVAATEQKFAPERIEPILESFIRPREDGVTVTDQDSAPAQLDAILILDSREDGVTATDQEIAPEQTATPPPLSAPYLGKPIQLGRNARRLRRPSPPAIIAKWANRSRELGLYGLTPPGHLDLSYNYPHRRKLGGIRRRRLIVQPEDRFPEETDEPVSLYRIIVRYVKTAIKHADDGFHYAFGNDELDWMQGRGYASEDVLRWGESLTEVSPNAAVRKLLEVGQRQPPVFLMLLFLRRIEIPRSAMAKYIEHLDVRLQHGDLEWATLKLLVIRLTRHARTSWVEILPWIASVFTSEVTRILSVISAATASVQSADITRFCNVFLKLLSLPCSLKSVLSSYYQETAQFQILQFMANSNPPLQVTRVGFRSLARTQLAHAKSLQEREWALLKGPTWPPWMHKRTAMDEGKGYQFGISRASAIVHRSFEAGYPGGQWEELAGVYAGWNVDGSPTIQTRTTLPTLDSTNRRSKRLEQLIWAARVRTTRTRTEAWAGFLAHEASDAPPSLEVYHAMFEKLHHVDARGAHSPFVTAPQSTESDFDAMLLAGDMKELIPEPTSPLDMIYTAERLPTWQKLYQRMLRKRLRPTTKLLAVLLDTTSDFDLGTDILQQWQNDPHHNGVVRHFLDGSLPTMTDLAIPGYFLASLVRFLCRFGRFASPPYSIPCIIVPAEHEDRLQHDPDYRLQYAYALLFHLRPRYRPAWTCYLQQLVYNSFGEHGYDPTSKYTVISKIVDIMHSEGIDLDEEQFQKLCIAVHYQAQSALQGRSRKLVHGHRLFTDATIQIRTLFQRLIKGNAIADGRSVGMPIPSPAVLHVYVRALGVLSDHEGLYSFTTWATENFDRITARADLQRGGPQILRRTLVAIRLALEGTLEDGMQPAPPDLVQRIRAQVEGTPDWGGWPSEDELLRYKRHRELRNTGG